MKEIQGLPAYSTVEICRKLGFTVSVDYLIAVGAKPAEQTGTGAYWWASEVSKIIRLIAASLANRVGAKIV